MHIEVIPTVNEARADDLLHKTVIAIDVLRATSTMLAALASGCRSIVPVETVNQALTLQQEGELLAGERFCKRIPGFQLGNSPLEFTPDAVGGKTVIMTTTNGTRAIQKSQKAAHVLIGGLLNAEACAREAARLSHEIVIVCAGTQDVFALEDGLCAGLLVEELMKRHECGQVRGMMGTAAGIGGGTAVGIGAGTSAASDRHRLHVNDMGLAMLETYRSVKGQVLDALLRSSNGARLSRIGYHNDVVFCARTNVFDFAPEVKNGRIEAVVTQLQ
ncbi:2-phosphosulfolactate phosphatase [Paenibacillus sp. YYML68]|uniref:2-phosphosulfolactate phosphatase n=1 Tax=Paenibacillus sp. YYML68 TaxID=2909250 RepID=UPI0024918204|nr:2-phosphosulfolactate phosphatase [Paenibacillus sp. YYML68]